MGRYLNFKHLFKQKSVYTAFHFHSRHSRDESKQITFLPLLLASVNESNQRSLTVTMF